LGLKQIDLAQITEVLVTAMAPKQGVIMKGGTIEIRLDSPQGILLGKSDFLDAGSSQRKLSTPIKLPDNHDKNLHDVYFVFVNPSPEQRSLMLIFGIEFKLKE
jgi:cytochrome c